MTARRHKVRQLLAALRTQLFNMQQNTCTYILKFCHAFGCETEFTDNASSGWKVNGITCLCWNMPCAGYSLLDDQRRASCPARGLRLSGELLRTGRCSGPCAGTADYPARAGKTVRTVADLIENEKLTCRPGRHVVEAGARAKDVQEPSWKEAWAASGRCNGSSLRN